MPAIFDLIERYFHLISNRINPFLILIERNDRLCSVSFKETDLTFLQDSTFFKLNHINLAYLRNANTRNLIDDADCSINHRNESVDDINSSAEHGVDYIPDSAADRIADRICGIRIFEDAAGKMNVSPADAGAEILIISQFTLYADTRSRRPGFTAAARPDTAIPLYERVIAGCRARGFRVETGEFGAEMQVASVNDGPVTLLFDTKDK